MSGDDEYMMTNVFLLFLASLCTTQRSITRLSYFKTSRLIRTLAYSFFKFAVKRVELLS